MNRLRRIFEWGLLAFFVLVSVSVSIAQQLIWSDEFDGTTLDYNKWDKPQYNRRSNHEGPDGWWLKQDSFLDGEGHLIIRARQIDNRNSDNDAFDYATGAIRSIDRFEHRYGKFEIRCKLPSQPGWWVAFWLFSPGVGNVDGSGEDGTEIDIFEGFGWTDRVQHALHWDGYGDAHQSTGEDFTMEGIRDGFHTFSLEWYENLYIFYIDGVESWRTDAGGVSKVPAYVKITGELSTQSWAINDWWANDPAKAAFPDSFIVDYVRVYELESTIATKPDPNDHLAYRKRATASSRSGSSHSPTRATDGNISTYWSSEASEPQWLSIDLRDSYTINKIRLLWGKEFGKEYKIEISESADGPWTECLHITDHDTAGLVTHEFAAQSGRYVRLYGIESANQSGLSVHEMAVYEAQETKVDMNQGDKAALPQSIKINSYPNPFNASTLLNYESPGGSVHLDIYNINGQKVTTLVNEFQAAGHYSVTWDAKEVPSGIYLVHFQANDHIGTEKIILQK